MAILNFWSSQRSKQLKFDELVRPHLNKLYQLAYRFSGNKCHAEDMVQDLLLKLYPRIDELAQIEQVGPWLARILYRHNIDNYRKQQRSALDLSSHEIACDEIQTTQMQPSDSAQQHQTQMTISQALDSLTDKHKDLIILHDVEGYTLAEIEKILSTPLGTLKSRLSRGRSLLREKLIHMEPFNEYRRVSQ